MESMMEKLCGTRTEENLRTAFAGESQARNKYTYYAKKAEEDGMNQIAERSSALRRLMRNSTRRSGSSY